MSASVLIVEDDRTQREFIATILQENLHLTPIRVKNGQECLEHLSADNTPPIKLVTLDLEMPVMGGIETLKILRERYPDLPVIVLTGTSNVEIAAEAMKLGAVDFFSKPARAERIIISARNALKYSILSREVSRLKRKASGAVTFPDLIGYEGGLRSIVDIGQKAAASNIPVLITGETGTGKEAFAQAIHGESARTGHPFIAVNCGALPENLVESILFGHEKGAFTGAIQKTLGKFREAEGGTIFLDEVGELTPEAQTKLLRVLQEQEIEPVGAGKSVRVDVRIISATNRDLAQDVKAGLFREDLFFRLNVLTITIPPLRARREDIPALVDHFVEQFSITENRLPKEVSPKALEKLQNYDWPGNVRQLENMISRTIVLSDGDVLNTGDIYLPASDVESSSTERHDTLGGMYSHHGPAITLLDTEGHVRPLKELEHDIIQEALNHFKGNITRTAKALGIAKSTIYRRFS